jgi:hypothetical protein
MAWGVNLAGKSEVRWEGQSRVTLPGLGKRVFSVIIAGSVAVIHYVNIF